MWRVRQQKKTEEDQNVFSRKSVPSIWKRIDKSGKVVLSLMSAVMACLYCLNQREEINAGTKLRFLINVAPINN